jgi:peptidoglycan/xylan/chitin deacetylase (PgdA/CDA1 family)
MSDAPVSRGKFLRSLGSSVTGMALGTGAMAAQALAAKLAAVLPPEPAQTLPKEKMQSTPEPDPFINRVSDAGNRIGLTFDDGPSPGSTDRILDELKKRQLHATFFMIGQQVAKSPDLARRVVAEGHEIGNHTYTHPHLNTLPDQQVKLELQQTQDIIEEVTKVRPVLFRPPYVAFRKNQAPIPHAMGMQIIVGDVNSRDWSQPGEAKIVEAILAQTSSGSILICHDNQAQTANCVGEFIDKLLERSFNFSTISSLVGPSKTAT